MLKKIAVGVGLGIVGIGFGVLKALDRGRPTIDADEYGVEHKKRVARCRTIEERKLRRAVAAARRASGAEDVFDPHILH